MAQSIQNVHIQHINIKILNAAVSVEEFIGPYLLWKKKEGMNEKGIDTSSGGILKTGENDTLQMDLDINL